MDEWKLRINTDRADTLVYLFYLLRQNRDKFINADFIEPATRNDFLNLMDWFEKAYDRRKALEAVNKKWSDK